MKYLFLLLVLIGCGESDSKKATESRLARLENRVKFMTNEKDYAEECDEYYSLLRQESIKASDHYLYFHEDVDFYQVDCKVVIPNSVIEIDMEDIVRSINKEKAFLYGQLKTENCGKTLPKYPKRPK